MITRNGNVGIGTTNPTEKLDVNGNAIITGSLTVTNGITGSLFGTASWAQNVPSSSLTGSFVTLDTNQTITGNKTFTPIQNTTPLTISGYSLTGSNAQSLLDLSGTWNTTGTPTLIKANVTETNSSPISLLFQLQKNSSNVFTVNKFGDITCGVIAGTGLSVTIGNNATSGVTSAISATRFFQPASGTAVLNNIQSTPTINQTGGANGITRGLYVNPTLTSAADWRSIEWSNNTGRGLYGSGSATNNIQGDTGIGLLTTPSAKLQIKGSGATSATTTLRVENSDATSSMVVLDNGNIGIGTTTPTQKLEVNGAILIEGNNTNNKLILGANIAQTFSLGTYYNGSFDTFFIEYSTFGVPKILNIQGNGNIGIGTTSPSAKLDVQGDILIKAANLSNQENLDVDTGTEVVATVAIATYTAAFFDFVIKNGTNVRSGTVFACHDGTNVEYTETSTNDLGNTTPITLSVDISGTDMRLLATTTTNNWIVKSLVRAL